LSATIVDLLAIDRHMGRRFNAKANAVAFYFRDFDPNVAVDDDAFS
jgi:hypothetical protein